MPGRKQAAEEGEEQIFACDLGMDGNASKGWNPGNVELQCALGWILGMWSSSLPWGAGSEDLSILYPKW